MSWENTGGILIDNQILQNSFLALNFITNPLKQNFYLTDRGPATNSRPLQLLQTRGSSSRDRHGTTRGGKRSEKKSSNLFLTRFPENFSCSSSFPSSPRRLITYLLAVIRDIEEVRARGGTGEKVTLNATSQLQQDRRRTRSVGKECAERCPWIHQSCGNQKECSRKKREPETATWWIFRMQRTRAWVLEKRAMPNLDSIRQQCFCAKRDAKCT